MRCIVSSLIAIASTTAAHAASFSEVAEFGANPGALKAYDYIPDGLPAQRPLVVVLHGCTQTAMAMENAGWDQLADQHGFAVLYPEQQTANNSLRCFTWWGGATDLVRGQGENASIVAMVDTEIATHAIDRDRVYVVGLSAGAAFTATMLATYPDRFAAGAIMAGLPYRCATDIAGTSACQNPGVTKTPAQWGDLVRAADPGFAGPFPRVQIWQGTADTTVAPVNADELVKQWTDVHGADQTADETETIGAATRTAYQQGGTIVVELYRIAGMNHGIAIGADPEGACTATPGAYFLDKGICSTLRAATFFGLISGGGGGTGSGDGGGGDGGTDASTGMDGGCSAGGGPGWIVALAGVALVRRRRPTITT
jgi:poly(hydroxyalkanoate) depolymerase family esterase